MFTFLFKVLTCRMECLCDHTCVYMCKCIWMHMVLYHVYVCIVSVCVVLWLYYIQEKLNVAGCCQLLDYLTQRLSDPDFWLRVILTLPLGQGHSHNLSLLHPRALQVRSSSPCPSRHPGLGGTLMPASSWTMGLARATWIMQMAWKRSSAPSTP